MLSTGSLWGAMARSFGTVTSNTGFGTDFVQAVNNVLDELSFSADRTTAISHVASPTSNISDLDADDSYIVSAGLVVHLIQFGWPHRSSDPQFFRSVALPLWESAKGAYMVKKSRDDQATVDDDGEATDDIIGLGYIGEE